MLGIVVSSVPYTKASYGVRVQGRVTFGVSGWAMPLESRTILMYNLYSAIER